MTGHGFHPVPDALGAACNRTKFVKDGRAMMQAWADCLDVLRIGGKLTFVRENGDG